MPFQPNYRYMLDVLNNRRPKRLPLYEHIIAPSIMEKVLGRPFAHLVDGDAVDLRAYISNYCRFFEEMTYDTVSFELCITDILPDHGAIMGGRPGPIQNREDFDRYPWDDLPRLYWAHARVQFDTLRDCMPQGMKGLGGVGNGVFEIAEDLVGFEYLCYLQQDDPGLFALLFQKIGDCLANIWQFFLHHYTDCFAICRFGDDLGFKTSTLLDPDTIRRHIIPQYQRVIRLVHQAGRPFLLHSCGNIFEVMDDLIQAGIDAKHSNEDNIASFYEWIDRYGDRIGLVGGIDVDILCHQMPADILDLVVDRGRKYRDRANGYALGSGNSIPDWIPVEGYLAMIEGVHRIRQDEKIS